MKISDWLIPNTKNKFHPHALRPLGLVVFALLFAVIQPMYNLTSTNEMQVLGYATDITIGDLHAISNQKRAKAGVAALKLDSQLNNAASAKASDMFAKDYWAHVSPDGTTPWTFMSNAGYAYVAAGENLAMNFNNSDGVVAGWMASAPHKSTLLGTYFKDVGYAVMNGTLQGVETTLVVAMYGARSAAPATPVQKSTPTTAKATPAPAAKKPAPAKKEAPKKSIPVETPAAADPAPTSNETGTEAVTEEMPKVEGIMDFAPVKAYQTLNWGQKASLALIAAMLLLFIMKHTLIWRARRRGVRHIWLRAHPIGQATVLTAAFIVTLLGGVGTVL